MCALCACRHQQKSANKLISAYTHRHMSNSISDTSTTVSSARELRTSLKQSQSNDAQLRLFNTLGKSIFEDGWQPESIQNLVQNLCAMMAVDHALVATESAGTLTVIAAKGRTLPIGARIPMMGAFASVLKYPVQFEIHSQGAARLWTYAEQDEYTEWLLPIAFKQKSVGLIALSGKNLVTTASDQLTLQSICGILGLALQQSDQKQLSAADESALIMLTPREREIFALLPSGLSNPELGAKLGIAPGTVKIHVERILSKLNLRDRTQAAVRAVELGYRST